jgi:hypothetical protein
VTVVAITGLDVGRIERSMVRTAVICLQAQEYINGTDTGQCWIAIVNRICSFLDATRHLL